MEYIDIFFDTVITDYSDMTLNELQNIYDAYMILCEYHILSHISFSTIFDFLCMMHKSIVDANIYDVEQYLIAYLSDNFYFNDITDINNFLELIYQYQLYNYITDISFFKYMYNYDLLNICLKLEQYVFSPLLHQNNPHDALLFCKVFDDVREVYEFFEIKES